MKYIPRYIEETIVKSSKSFKVVFLGGPRQVGKTTTLQKLAKDLNCNYLTLDDLNLRDLAKKDPALFLQQASTPLIIDEVQYAPELFPQIKKIVDEKNKNGQFWLTGSQQFSLIRNIQETLAGRVAILNILGLSRREKELKTSDEKVSDKPNIKDLFQDIFVGSMPVFYTTNPPDRDIYFNSYVQTYLDRDLSDLFGIGKIAEFNRFLQACAARTGQVLNISDLARDSGISSVTAKDWLGILESTMQIYLLKPYYPNVTKRIIKSPKLYFLDTGLAAYLSKWNTKISLQSGSQAGAFYETYILGEFVKKYINKGMRPPFYYLRDKEGHEVDLVIEEDGFHLYEFKLSATLKSEQSKELNYYASKFKNCKTKTVISLIEIPIVKPKDISHIPYTSI